jgi:CBS domain-containing protein
VNSHAPDKDTVNSCVPDKETVFEQGSAEIGNGIKRNPSHAGEASQCHPASKRTRLYVCTRQDQLRLVLERLSMPAVRRVIVVHPDTRKVEGIISLSDVARFMFMSDPELGA